MAAMKPEKFDCWRDLFIVGATALATVLGADWILRSVCPPLPPRMEFSDGFSAFVDENPDVMVLGSSHARAYVALQKQIAERTSGRVTLSVLPLEWGKLSSYLWAIENRIGPYLKQDRASANPRTSSLRHLILVTEWWDHCSPTGGHSINIPARAWTLKHFLADLASNGLTNYNRSYLTSQWGFLWRWTILGSDRGVGRLPHALWAWIRGTGGLETEQSYQGRIRWWQDMIERAIDDPNCQDGRELQALDRIVQFADDFDLELTVVLHPRMPSTLTPKGKSTTLARFSRLMQERAQAQGFRLIDETTTSPLQDNDFMSDLDHVTDRGALTLANWALDSELFFLLTLDEPAMQNHL